MIEDQDVLRVLLLPGKSRSYSPHSGDTFDAQLGSVRLGSQSAQLARSQSFSLALLARALRDTPRRERTRWIYTCTRDIIAASSRHAALVRTGSPRALLPSSCGRRRERKKRDAVATERERETRRKKCFNSYSIFHTKSWAAKIGRQLDIRYCATN